MDSWDLDNLHECSLNQDVSGNNIYISREARHLCEYCGHVSTDRWKAIRHAQSHLNSRVRRQRFPRKIEHIEQKKGELKRQVNEKRRREIEDIS